MKQEFSRRKKDVLSKQDKSYKGSWDKHIKKLCDKINSYENYYTTSSCSGRIVLIINQEKKERNLFIKVYHDKISFDELKKELDSALKKKKKIKFKFEPCALHVSCKTLEDAQKLYNQAKLAGWKRSGIIATTNRFMVELNSTEHLELPIIENNKILVDDNFLKIIVKESNKKLENSWKKIEKLKRFL